MGLSSVNGDSTYVNVTKEDMMESAYAGYLANINYLQNDYGLVPQGDEVADPADITALPFANGFSALGFYSFLVCDISTAERNWALFFGMNITEATCDYYPLLSGSILLILYLGTLCENFDFPSRHRQRPMGARFCPLLKASFVTRFLFPLCCRAGSTDVGISRVFT